MANEILCMCVCVCVCVCVCNYNYPDAKDLNTARMIFSGLLSNVKSEIQNLGILFFWDAARGKVRFKFKGMQSLGSVGGEVSRSCIAVQLPLGVVVCSHEKRAR
ncbi:hypothetical protein QBC36DRAFT_339165 [Triangularia setosa]|uniref:Secreted protein n=1 Tax=Triangularia setosa TaxID=2587417 RepID=A0AAN6W089_9PEZI|nr:hypothetical protein QBC36DRAFT_339165 [Podospora setosa]